MPIDKKTAREIVRQARQLAKKDLLELAGSENIELWHSRDLWLDAAVPGA